ncbi:MULTISPECIES: lytic transglycosylase [Pseudofrankia]|uniref:lytic transglycosylase n=1 Tax=Pseudofrankia TaxID=2994363 RepID=UPI000234B28D|nr:MULTISPECIES: LysM peptidoglycan-binding domain-containing protein [Pseudofrankia]OHV35930.1 lytic transglycosylase [Pseudofrankia sp. EUN1h]
MPPRRPIALARAARLAHAQRPSSATVRGAGLLVTALAVALAGGAAAGGWGPYEVSPGDSLWSLAARHGTTVERIRTVNGLPDDELRAGELLYLPGSHSGAAETAQPRMAGGCASWSPAGACQPAPPPGGYVVQPGESLSVLAARAGLSVADLAARNGLGPDDGLRIGQILLVTPDPGQVGTPAITLSASTSAPVLPGASGDGVVPGVAAPAGPVPALSAIGQTQLVIRAEAARQGIDPTLALAIASVESGFDPTAVSRVGAVGVMQLMPRTARWLSTVLDRPVDQSNPADNIAGGVAFLRFLLAETSGDVPTTVGSYYQGLDSVRRYGFFPDTQEYVGKVIARRAHFTAAP